MMKLYSYWRSSSAWRVRVALAHKGVLHEVVPVHLLRAGGEQHAPDFVVKNALSQVPVLEVEHGGEVVTLTQSLAIIDYLEAVYPEPPLLPAEPLARARVLQVAEVINSAIQPMQNTSLIARLGGMVPDFDAVAWFSHFMGRGLRMVEELVKCHAGRYSIGDSVTLADVCVVPQLYASRRMGHPLDGCPTLLRVERACLELSAFQSSHPDAQPDRDIAL